MRRIVVIACLVLVVLLAGGRMVAAQFVSPLVIEQTRNIDGYQLIDIGRAVNVACNGNRRIAVIEQTEYRVMLGCVAADFTPVATATMILSTVTPTPMLTPQPTMTIVPTPTPSATTVIVPTATSPPTPTATATVTPTEVLSMTTYTIQPDGTAGIDTYITAASADSGADAAYGTSDHFRTRGNVDAAYRTRSLLKFDLSSIPGTDTVSSATLYLYQSHNGVWNNSTQYLHRILAANSGWVEGATWNYANPSTARWAGDTGSNGGSDAGASVSGTDYSSTPLATWNYVAAQAVGTEYAITLDVAEVEAMIDANYGMVFFTTYDGDGGLFCTSDHATSDYRPKLVIVHAAAGGTDVPAAISGAIRAQRIAAHLAR